MQQRYQQIRRVTLIGAAVNTSLAFAKLLCGFLGASHALIADGIHSFSDLLTDFLVIIAAKFSNQAADSDHPYGHARIETAASLGLALFLAILGLGIIIDAAKHLLAHDTLVKPHAYVLWIAALSILVNEGLYRYTAYVGKKINSELLIANAWHSRGDAASSLVVFIGVLGSLLGLVYLDAAAAIIVGAMIIKMGWQIGWNNLRELVDTGLDEKTIKRINQVIFSVAGVKSVHELRSRKMAERALLDLHVTVDPFITVSEGHHIGECVMAALKKQVDIIDDVVVHIDSENDEQYSSTSRLPLRDVVTTQLQELWQGLPGFADVQQIRLHYLAGAITVELELPLTLIESMDGVDSLVSEYTQAAQPIEYISQINLLFRA